MKKIAIIAISAFLIFLLSCNKEPVIESTPPSGIWEELNWCKKVTEDGDTVLERMIWDDIRFSPFRDSVNCSAMRLEFPNSSLANGDIKMLTRYIYGSPKEGSDSLDCFDQYDAAQNLRNIEYAYATYSIIDDKDVFGNKMKVIVVNGAYTKSDYVTEPDRCSSQGNFTRRYEFRYENEEKTMMSLGYNDSLRSSIQLFVKI